MEIYKIYNDKTSKHIASIIYNPQTNEYTSEVFPGYEEMMIFSKFNYGDIQWGAEPHPESKSLEFWLSDRVIPPNRDMLKETLARMGIYEYDWKVLIKLNHGRSVSDWYSVEVEEV